MYFLIVYYGERIIILFAKYSSFKVQIVDKEDSKSILLHVPFCTVTCLFILLHVSLYNVTSKHYNPFILLLLNTVTYAYCYTGKQQKVNLLTFTFLFSFKQVTGLKCENT